MKGTDLISKEDLQTHVYNKLAHYDPVDQELVVDNLLLELSHLFNNSPITPSTQPQVRKFVLDNINAIIDALSETVSSQIVINHIFPLVRQVYIHPSFVTPCLLVATTSMDPKHMDEEVPEGAVTVRLKVSAAVERKILPDSVRTLQGGKLVPWEHEPLHLDGAALFGRNWCMIHKEDCAVLAVDKPPHDVKDIPVNKLATEITCLVGHNIPLAQTFNIHGPVLLCSYDQHPISLEELQRFRNLMVNGVGTNALHPDPTRVTPVEILKKYDAMYQSDGDQFLFPFYENQKTKWEIVRYLYHVTSKKETIEKEGKIHGREMQGGTQFDKKLAQDDAPSGTYFKIAFEKNEIPQTTTVPHDAPVGSTHDRIILDMEKLGLVDDYTFCMAKNISTKDKLLLVVKKNDAYEAWCQGNFMEVGLDQRNRYLQGRNGHLYTRATEQGALRFTNVFIVGDVKLTSDNHRWDTVTKV